jgi:2-polyprenyl-6-methoxyphenol hydroxylase-like FAD-dependent oxidoreductase
VSEVIERVVVVGGGVAGLGVAIGLANLGIPVTVLERNPKAECATGEAFNDWRRPGVSQFRHAHGFSARSRNLMLEHAPEVVEDLLAEGVEVVNFFKLLAPPELWTDADDAYGALWTRRPGFELALRRHAERVAEVRSPVAVAGLTFADEFGHPRRVTGVRLADGTEIAADLIVPTIEPSGLPSLLVSTLPSLTRPWTRPACHPSPRRSARARPHEFRICGGVPHAGLR